MKVFDQQATENFFKNFCVGTGDPVKGIRQDENGNLLRILKWLKHYDEYYAIVNIKDNRISWDFGIYAQLGYSRNEIAAGGIMFLRNLIHPFVRDWHNLFTTQAIQLFKNNEPGWKDMRSPRYIINIPVRKKNGNHVFVKQMLFPFQRDKNNNLVSYMNTFTIVDEYRGQPLRPRFFENSDRQEEWEKEIKRYASRKIAFAENENFTQMQFKFIDRFLFQNFKDTENKSNRGFNSRKNEMAELLKIAPSTIGVHQSNIFKKIKNLFFHPFKDHTESLGSDTYMQCMSAFANFESSVIFLQKSGILSVMKYSFEKTYRGGEDPWDSFKIMNF